MHELDEQPGQSSEPAADPGSLEHGALLRQVEELEQIVRYQRQQDEVIVKALEERVIQIERDRSEGWKDDLREWERQRREQGRRQSYLSIVLGVLLLIAAGTLYFLQVPTQSAIFQLVPSVWMVALGLFGGFFLIAVALGIARGNRSAAKVRLPRAPKKRERFQDLIRRHPELAGFLAFLDFREQRLAWRNVSQSIAWFILGATALMILDKVGIF